MTGNPKRSDRKPGSVKVVLELEESDDGLHLSLQGLEALRGLRDTLSSLGCCIPIAVACKAPDQPAAGKPAAD